MAKKKESTKERHERQRAALMQSSAETGGVLAPVKTAKQLALEGARRAGFECEIEHSVLLFLAKDEEAVRKFFGIKKTKTPDGEEMDDAKTLPPFSFGFVGKLKNLGNAKEDAYEGTDDNE